jgi:hypothetical protein
MRRFALSSGRCAFREAVFHQDVAKLFGKNPSTLRFGGEFPIAVEDDGSSTFDIADSSAGILA